MKKLSMVIMTVLGIVSLGIFAGCADVLNPHLQEESGGTGRALVRIGSRPESARTLMPENTENYADLSYTLTFTPVSGYGVEKSVSLESGGEAAVDLEAGTWNLAVTGYKDGTAVLEGSASNIEVRSGETIPVSVAMNVKTEGGDGTLSYAVTFPDAVIKGWLKVYGLADGTVAQTVDLLETPTSGEGTKTKSGELALSGGYYRLGIDLYTANGVVNRSDIAHVYPGQTTVMGTDYAVFGINDFAAADIVIDTETTLVDVLNGISSLSGAAAVYFLGAGDESMAPVSVSHIGGSVTVTIDGGGRAVTLNGDGSLITVGRGVTLKLKNITLRGKGEDVNNSAALITVNTGGTLELNEGVVITGNKHSSHSASGGGVYVGTNGTFIMEGGEISGNTTSGSSHSSGGGVYVGTNGTFTMEGGEISGNTAVSASYSASGGGVYVETNGTFTMEGGEISGNSAAASSHSSGGGVYVETNGTFTMEGGEISGNTTSASYSSEGGGVYVYGTFTMEGGEISGNTASDGGGAASYGGGVYVYYYGTFTMEGGEISGNTASYGGGVYVQSGTFTMEGGEISGNTASTSGASYYSRGGGVYVEINGTFTMYRGEISGNSAVAAEYSRGGGVCVEINGTFTMEGGEISGNSAAASYSSEGGGVYVDTNGTFIMEGGEISGNSAASATSHGGGVCVDGRFTKKGGIIYGDADATAGNGNATDNTAISGSGHAVYADGIKRRNSTAGPAVTLYATYDSDTSAWTFNDTSTGGVGDTAGNWEQ
jgi:hypothetical protein